MQNDYKEPSDAAQTRLDEIDRTLDAALARYAAVEPGGGLEQRVLARMQCQRHTIPTPSWWQWGTVGALTAVLTVMAALAWRSNQPARSVVEQRPSPSEIVSPSSTLAPSSQAGMARMLDARSLRAKPRRIHPPAVPADGPKLDQFPSPKPLTGEELALVRYVRQFPQEAAMVASAQEEFENEVQREDAAGRQATPNSIQEER
jgi:hypothetical protein